MSSGAPTTISARPSPSTSLDGDGDPDLLSASSGDDRIAWFENLAECSLLDADLDALRDAEELLLHGTDPALADSDSGGLEDGRELDLGGDALDPRDDAASMLTLSPPVPGVAGSSAHWIVLGAEPGRRSGSSRRPRPGRPRCRRARGSRWACRPRPWSARRPPTRAAGPPSTGRCRPRPRDGVVLFQAVGLGACTKSRARSDEIR